MAKVVSKLREKLAPKQAMKPQTLTMGPNGVMSGSTGGLMPSANPATAMAANLEAQEELKRA